MGDALCDPVKDGPLETDLIPEDSVSQVTSCQDAMSTTSSKLLARQIDPDRRRAELELFTPVIWLGRRRMPLLLRPLRLTPGQVANR